MADIDLYMLYQKDILLWIKDMYGLVPQKVLPEYQSLLEECRASGEYNPMRKYMFEPFKKGEHITWHQHETCLAINRAVNGEIKKISIRSGHWVGKSSIIAIVILWFLFCNFQSVVGCTAPTSSQMNDVLRKELSLWINRLPDEVKKLYERTNEYIRISGFAETRFARARTGKKENPEALAGLHADDLMILADEASGVAEEVFTTSESALTNENTLFLMISNPTRTEWYFYNSHNELSYLFHCLHFNSEESPIVSKKFVESVIAKFGIDSDEYRVRVLGEFPRVGEMDDKGYMPLFERGEVKFAPDISFIPNTLWIDAWGEGKDKSIRCGRDSYAGWVLAEEQKSNEKTIAQKTLTLITKYPRITDKRTFYDNFGVGANVGTELAYVGYKAKWCNNGEKADDTERFANKRAECYWRMKEAIRLWFQIVGTESERDDLFKIKFKRNERGQIQIMPKIEMKKLMGKSPDRPDALALTFREEDKKEKKEKSEAIERVVINPFTGERVRRKHLSHNQYIEWI